MTAETSIGTVQFSFKHQRATPPMYWGSDSQGHHFQGETRCFLRTPQGEYCGITLCSISDNFNKEKGRKLALTRAMQAAGLSRKDRREVWMSYFARFVPEPWDSMPLSHMIENYNAQT